MRFILLLLFLAACGGGSGGGYTAPAPELVQQRTDSLRFGYYGGEPGQVAATFDHINLMHSVAWDGEDVQIAEMQMAKVRGVGIMLDLPEAYQSEQAVRAKLFKLASLDLLGSVKAIYPIDEPDYAGKSAETIGVTNAMVRRVAGEFNLKVPLAVIYAATFTWPGAAYYDWVGFNNYYADIFGNGDYDRLKRATRADQRILLVPGGADKWRQDPQPFLARALSDPQVIGIIAFLWRDNADPANGAGLGIKSNGMKHAYCVAGRAAINRQGIC